MDKEEVKKDCNCEEHGNWKHKWHSRGHHGGGGSAGFFGFAFIGALFYFLQNAVTFNDYIWGIGKAIFWPALLVFKTLTLLAIK
jgi:hypothetical protein